MPKESNYEYKKPQVHPNIYNLTTYNHWSDQFFWIICYGWTVREHTRTEQPHGECEWFKHKLKRPMEFLRPESVRLCSEYMGGVDKSEMVLTLYRSKYRSRKWYHRIIFYIISQCTVKRLGSFSRKWWAKQLPRISRQNLFCARWQCQMPQWLQWFWYENRHLKSKKSNDRWYP